MEFAKHRPVIGFNISASRIEALLAGIDSTNEVESTDLRSVTLLEFTTKEKKLADANIMIVCVPTPVDKANEPDFSLLISASETVGRNMKRGTIVVFESTVYPRATEEICVPAIEKASRMKWKRISSLVIALNALTQAIKSGR